MKIRTPQLPQINLARSPFEHSLFVDMERFFEFSFWLAEELLDLEARFQRGDSGSRSKMDSMSAKHPALPSSQKKGLPKRQA